MRRCNSKIWHKGLRKHGLSDLWVTMQAQVCETFPWSRWHHTGLLMGRVVFGMTGWANLSSGRAHPGFLLNSKQASGDYCICFNF